MTPTAIIRDVETNERNNMNSIFERIHSVLVIGVVNSFRKIPSFLNFVFLSMLPYTHVCMMLKPIIPVSKKSKKVNYS